jgi:hypothetical protein
MHGSLANQMSQFYLGLCLQIFAMKLLESWGADLRLYDDDDDEDDGCLFLHPITLV